jgi:hypothetical protein
MLTSVEKANATFPSTSGVKQGDNLAAPILFLFDVQAAVELMNEKWRFRKPDLSVS